MIGLHLMQVNSTCSMRPKSGENGGFNEYLKVQFIVKCLYYKKLDVKILSSFNWKSSNFLQIMYKRLSHC